MENIQGRIVRSMDKDWFFHLGEVETHIGVSHNDIYNTAKAGACRGVPQKDYDAREWEVVSLPHDWSVRQPFDKSGSPSWGYKPKGTGWYRKSFFLPKEYEGKQLTITFDGVAKNCTVYFNGSVIYRNFTGYAPFTVDISDRAFYETQPNVLAVYVDGREWEGWWYEGAGIYRHVNLEVREKVNIAENGLFVKPIIRNGKWIANITLDIANNSYEDKGVTVLCRISDVRTVEKVTEYKFETFTCNMETCTKEINLFVNKPKIWDIDDPNLYNCEIVLFDGEKVLDNTSVNFGFRTIEFTADKGFFLNGRKVKIYGTCNHQDHAGLGVAVADSIHEYRISRLKEMGSNAYRCAHGMPHKELLDECDRQGMLVLDENRNFETSEECLEQLRKMVKRDRNHPSVIMYSIFNEEPLQGTSNGAKMAERMRHEIHRLDDSRLVTGAMSGGVLEPDGCANALDVCGVNYQLDVYDEFHKRNPDRCMLGSETTSTFSVRDCYKTDMDKHEISCYDEDPASWGHTVRQTWSCIRHRDFAAGGFMWTGFDYLGEPTPFEWPSVSSFFGMMDTCGFAKDGYYLCQSFFKSEPVVHVLPHWNFSGHEGENIRVMCHTNCEEGEVFVNGKSFGRKTINPDEQAYWEIPFEAGELKLVGYNGGKAVGEDIRHTAGKPYEIRFVPFKNELLCDGLDVTPVNIIAVDENGNELTDFEELISLECEGGEIIGTSNGDPNCHEDFLSTDRHLFHGKAQAVIRCKKGAKSLTLCGKCGMLKIEKLHIKTVECNLADYVESVSEQYVNDWYLCGRLRDEAPDIMLLGTDPTDNNSFEPVNVALGFANRLIGKQAQGKFAVYKTTVNIPQSINGRMPVLHFHKVLGECKAYVGKKFVGECVHEWAADSFECKLDKDMTGLQEIVLVVKIRCDYGGGICSSVIIR